MQRRKGLIYWLGMIPVVFVAFMGIWAYYAYIFQFNLVVIKTGEPPGGNALWILLFVVFHCIFLSFSISFIKVVFVGMFFIVKERYCVVDSGGVPAAFDEEQELLSSARERTIHGRVRFCKICKQHKPDRAHHCSVCGRCVLRMDHHCPWIGNCVGYVSTVLNPLYFFRYKNHQWFFKFLFHTELLCLFVFFTILPMIGTAVNHSSKYDFNYSVILVFIMAICFTVSVSVLLGFHIHLLRNADWPYDLGWKENMGQILGRRMILWWLPIGGTLPLDGMQFPRREQSGGMIV